MWGWSHGQGAVEDASTRVHKILVDRYVLLTGWGTAASALTRLVAGSAPGRYLVAGK